MDDFEFWAQSPRELRLANDEIHLWRAYLGLGEPRLSKFQSMLQTDERVRADRYFFQRDRNRFVITRGLLRELLAKYVGGDPNEIPFEYAPRGKPFLGEGFKSSPIRFNVSHSHGLALFAFALGRDVGVDVEMVRPDFGGDEIAERYFAPEEIKELQALPKNLRAEGFFLGWTRKEAYIKARGAGLQIPLCSFDVSLTPGQPELLHSEDSSRWSLRSLRPDGEYVGALVGEGHGWSLRCWDWNPL